MIRQARRHEFSAIEGWRTLHFAQLNTGRPLENQPGFDDGLWLVVDRHGVAVAATCVHLDEARRILTVEALFAAPGHALAGVVLADYLERFCDEGGYELQSTTDPENWKYLRYILARGYEVTSVHYRRRPRSQRKDVQASETIAATRKGVRDSSFSEVPVAKLEQCQ